MIKHLSLLFLRLGTGGLLILWGFIKVASPEAAIGVSDKYYEGTLSAASLQMPLGVLQVTLGVLVVVGLFRKVVYPISAVVLGVGLLAIWKYILDPFGLYLLTPETRNPLFFPSLTVFGASLALIAFKSEDKWSLDRLIFK